MLEAMESVAHSTASLAQEAPPRLKPNVMAAIAKEQAEKKKNRLRRILPGGAIGAVAAVLALLVGTGVIPLRQFGSSTDAARPEKSSYAENVAETAAAPEAYGAIGETGAPGAAADDWAESMMTATAANSPEAYDGLLDAEAETAEVEEPAEAAEDAGQVKRSGTQHAPTTLLSPEQIDRLQSFSTNAGGAVLAYEGLGERFAEELCVIEPSFAALLEDAVVTEEDGMYVLQSDLKTVFAIHEWLAQALSEEELSNALRFSRISEYDPDSACLTTVITMPERGCLTSLPPDWPEDFPALFREGKNWLLFYPREDYRPEQDSPAYLVLLPST